MKVVLSLLTLSFLPQISLASSSYGARTNQEFQAVLNDIQSRFDAFENAVESIQHDYANSKYGIYIVKTSEPCTYKYQAVRGNAESDGLRGVTLLNKTCK